MVFTDEDLERGVSKGIFSKDGCVLASTARIINFFDKLAKEKLDEQYEKPLSEFSDSEIHEEYLRRVNESDIMATAVIKDVENLMELGVTEQTREVVTDVMGKRVKCQFNLKWSEV